MSAKSEKKNLNKIRILNMQQPQIVTPPVGILFLFLFPQSDPCYKTLRMISLHFCILCICISFDLKEYGWQAWKFFFLLKKETLSSLKYVQWNLHFSGTDVSEAKRLEENNDPCHYLL